VQPGTRTLTPHAARLGSCGYGHVALVHLDVAMLGCPLVSAVSATHVGYSSRFLASRSARGPSPNREDDVITNTAGDTQHFAMAFRLCMAE
jgi:hypothetical protein